MIRFFLVLFDVHSVQFPAEHTRLPFHIKVSSGDTYGIAPFVAQCVAQWGIAKMCLCETKYQGGVLHHFAGVLTSLKRYFAIWGIAVMISQYRAI